MEYTFGAGGDRPVAGRWTYTNSCSFLNTSGINKRLFKAPIDGNPPVLKSNGSGFQEILSSAFSKLNVTRYADAPSSGTGTTRWLYVENQENNPITPGWIKASEVTVTTPACDNALLVNDTSRYYSLPDIPWTINLSSTASPLTFRSWPVSAETMCSRTGSLIGFYGLNRAANPSLYPRQVHPGLDFFTPDTAQNIPILSMSDGIVVGIGIGRNAPSEDPFNQESNRVTHRIWGATANTEGIIGYSVIVRSGYLYILYGYLKSIEGTIWVGAPINAAQKIGTLGLYESRHVHVEIHSYGASTTNFYGGQIRRSGILPVGGIGENDVAPYLYDAAQLLINLPEIVPPPFPTRVTTSNLTPTAGNNVAQIPFSPSNCLLKYETTISSPFAMLETLSGYRTTYEYSRYGSSVSINTQTIPPPP
jgi:murein DD-endopeptidase MepM/ murein hydrolase activator NlpD